MKTKFIYLTSLLIAVLTITNSSAQSFKEMKKMVKESMNTKADTTGLKQIAVIGGENQYIMVEAFMNSGKKFFSRTVYHASSNIVKGTIQDPTMSDYFFRNLKRNDKNQIVEFDGYTPNETAYPTYFKTSSNAIYFIKDMAFEFRRYFTSSEDYNKMMKDNNLYVEVHCADKSRVKNIEAEEITKLMTNYLDEVSKGVNEVRANEKAAADKAEADKRAKYTTKGKDVVKLKLVSSGNTCEQGKTYIFDIIAVLKNGTEISTANGGYTDEYSYSWTGLPEQVDGLFGKVKAVNGNSFTVPNNAVIQGDKITITVKSNHYPNQTATITYTMDYSANVICDYNAYINSASGSARTRGGNLRIEIKAAKHAVTGKELLEYKVFGSSGNLLRHFKVNQGAFVSAECCGQKGWKGQDGTDGGDITIVIDPSVSSYTLNTKNNGGAAGQGGYPGKAGNVEKLKQKVSW